MPKVQLGDINIYYESYGEGYPLVGIFGWASTRRSFKWSIPDWSKHFRCIIFDYRGIGQTEAPDAAFTIRDMAQDTLGLMDALGIEQAHLVGQSSGSMVAQEIAINWPDRVRGLVLCSTTAKHDPHSTETYLVRRILKKKLEPLEFYRWTILHAFTPEHYNDHADSMLAGAKEWQEEGQAWLFDRIVDAALAHDSRGRLHLIKAPTLVVIGAQDQSNNIAMARQVHESIPGAEFALVEGAAHSVYAFPGYTQRILDFLIRVA